VKRYLILLLSVMLEVVVATATPQTTGHHFPTPPESMAPQEPVPPQDSSTRLVKHADMAQLQHEADDLARTALTIPPDVANVRKGMLPKDVIEKLKQIEKLSKHLRTELSR
jgi:hypothetical protein